MSAQVEPTWDDGTLAAAATEGLPEGPSGSWIALPPGGPIKLLVPRDHTGAGAPALRHLMGHTSPLRRLGAELGAQAIALGGDRLLRPRPLWIVAANRLLGHARAVSGLDDAVGVIRLNPARPNRKPVIQLLSHDHRRTIGYVKIGWDGLTAPLVRREIATLSSLDAPDSLRIPEILGSDIGDVPALAVTPLVQDASDRRAGAPVDLARAALRVFGPDGFGTNDVQTLGSCLAVTGTAEQLERLGDQHYAGEVARRLATVRSRYGNLELPTGRWHGDWNRANVAVAGDDVAAWDWERSTRGAPHGLDAAYTLLNEHTPDETRTALSSLGVPAERIDALCGLALVIAATRHAEAIALGVQTKSAAALRLLDTALAG